MNNMVSFTPLLRQTVGFDHFGDLFETVLGDAAGRFDTYPPYNIEKHGEDEYRIVMAVAGFRDSDLHITAHGDKLIVTGRIDGAGEEDGTQYLHRGLAMRPFERTFRLADYIEVKEAEVRDGLLAITLKREVPEEKKPRMIEITNKADSDKKE